MDNGRRTHNIPPNTTTLHKHPNQQRPPHQLQLDNHHRQQRHPQPNPHRHTTPTNLGTQKRQLVLRNQRTNRQPNPSPPKHSRTSPIQKTKRRPKIRQIPSKHQQNMNTPTITGITIIRNALQNGYPIAEVIQNLDQISQEIIIIDGHSTDGTYQYLQTLNNPKIKLIQTHWQQGNNGQEFATITNQALQHATQQYIHYQQADEIYHPHHLQQIPQQLAQHQPNTINYPIYHIRYDLNYHIDPNSPTQAYTHCIRTIKNHTNIHSHYDAYTFEGNTQPQITLPYPIYHIGYIFIHNILNKIINHATHYYQTNPEYQTRAQKAQHYLTQLQQGTLQPTQTTKLQIAQDLEPFYTLTPHNTPIPQNLHRLTNNTHYTLPNT